MSNDTSIAYQAVNIPTSQRIRERLLASKTRFHANDNIAKFIEPGELAEQKSKKNYAQC